MENHNPISPQDAYILIVEDDPNNRLVVVKLLGVVGIPADQITELPGNPLPHLQARTDPLDIILLDIQLPEKDGYTILKEIRADPELADLRVIALTANVMKTDVEQAREAGFDGFIGKPIDGRRFPQWIGEILAGDDVWAVV